MKCPICKNELEIKNKKVGENANGEAVYNEFAICHDCKKQWNLDKQRAKKEAPAKDMDETAVTEAPKPKKRKKRPVSSENPAIEAPASDTAADAPARPRPKKKRRPVPSDENTMIPRDSIADTQTEPESPAKPHPQKKRRPASAPNAEVSAHSAEERPARERPNRKPLNPEASSEERPVKRRPDSEQSAKRPAKKRPAKRPVPDSEHAEKERPVKEHPVKERPVRERPAKVKPAPRAMDEPIDEFSGALDDAYNERPRTRKRRTMENTVDEQAYSNIPPKHVREARENEMRENYQNMLDEGEDEEEGGRFPVVLIVILVILILAAAAFAGYWFLLR